MPELEFAPFPAFVVAKRLGLGLGAVAVYTALVVLAERHLDIHIPDWGIAAGLINGVILGLLMGFRNRTAYDRWWEARRLWGQLTNDIRNLVVKLNAFIPADALAKSNVGDLLTAFAEALARHLRGERPKLRDFPEISTTAEDPKHLPMYLSARLHAIVADWKRAGIVDDGLLIVLDSHLRGLLDVCGGCERIRDTPISPSYKGLLRVGLVLNLVVAPWYAIPDLGWWSLPVILLAAFFLLGVELIDTAVEEPFGSDLDDLDLDRYCRTIREAVTQGLVSHRPPA